MLWETFYGVYGYNGVYNAMGLYGVYGYDRAYNTTGPFMIYIDKITSTIFMTFKFRIGSGL